MVTSSAWFDKLLLTSMLGHVACGVTARSTELLGYQDLMVPSLREKRVPVEGHSMQ
jgi:hypothetical protein